MRIFSRFSLWQVLVALAFGLITASAAQASRCKTTGWFIQTTSCTYHESRLQSRPGIYRDVRWQVPEGTPPAGGWPVVIMYQGSFFPIQFKRSELVPFGGYYEVKVIEKLLNNGYAVIAPDAGIDLFWETNLPVIYELTADYLYINNLFDAIENGAFGNVNPNKKFATGISSGGYNTSRMAVTWPTEFRALAVQSGSYATCSGPICFVPGSLAANHPPTYFLHGWVDLVVPWWSMDMYYDELIDSGIPTGRTTNWLAGHEWIPEAPARILAWFNAYR
jgi:poly(3-hydroxybutyrate) depolymerase